MPTGAAQQRPCGGEGARFDPAVLLADGLPATPQVCRSPSPPCRVPQPPLHNAHAPPAGARPRLPFVIQTPFLRGANGLFHCEQRPRFF